jgi:hypothetical protein
MVLSGVSARSARGGQVNMKHTNTVRKRQAETPDATLKTRELRLMYLIPGEPDTDADATVEAIVP